MSLTAPLILHTNLYGRLRELLLRPALRAPLVLLTRRRSAYVLFAAPAISLAMFFMVPMRVDHSLSAALAVVGLHVQTVILTRRMLGVWVLVRLDLVIASLSGRDYAERACGKRL